MKRKVEGDTLCIADDNGGAVLTIRETLTDSGELKFTVGGSITSDAAPEFEDELMTVLTTGRSVIADFAQLRYISAPGLNALLSAQRLVDENLYSFRVENMTEPVREVFETTGFIDLIEIAQ